VIIDFLKLNKIDFDFDLDFDVQIEKRDTF